MHEVKNLLRDFALAVAAVAAAIWAMWRPARHLPHPFIGKDDCTEAGAYTYLLGFCGDIGHVPVLVDTDLGNGRQLWLRGSQAGSLIYQQAESVIMLIVLMPGLTIPASAPARARLACEISGRALGQL